MKTKVKLSCPTKSLDFLLLVIKINRKGLLVNHLPKLEPGDFVDLGLRNPALDKKIDLKGSIHKNIVNAKGSKGTIVRFEKMTSKEIIALDDFLKAIDLRPEPSKPEATPSPMKAPEAAPQQTLVVAASSLSHLALESPDQDQDFVPSTFDEESLDHQNRSQGLQGMTVVGHKPVASPSSKKGGRGAKFVKNTLKALTVLILIAASLNWLNHRLAILKTFSSESPPVDSSVKNEAPAEQTPTSPPKPVPKVKKKPVRKQVSRPKPKPRKIVRRKKIPKKAPVRAPRKRSINRLVFSESEAFFKVTIGSGGEIGKPKVSRSISPTRAIHFDFIGHSKSLKKNTQNVQKTPLSRIQINKRSEGTRITLELNSPRFPRYDVQSYPDTVDIFIYKE